MSEPTATGRITGKTITADLIVRRQRCGAAAPLVVNGGMFAGCELEPGHDGMHKTTVEWT